MGHRIALIVALLAAAAGQAAAERLPVKVYTVDNGLAHNRVKRIVQDSRGFLWFCTADGLSRFDGTQFTNYQNQDGLLAPSINDIVEGRDGIYWVATNSDGVFRFDPGAGTPAAAQAVKASRFTRYAVGSEPITNRVNVLYRDPAAGILWAGTDGGLFALNEAQRDTSFRLVLLGIPAHPDIQVPVWAIVKDQAGTLWLGTKYGLVRRFPDGSLQHFQVQPSATDDNVSNLLAARDGTLWVGHRAGLIAFKPKPDPAVTGDRGITRPLPADARHYTTKDGLDDNNILAVHESADGSLWIRTFGPGLTRFDGKVFRTYRTAPHVSDTGRSMTEDREGNLWLGTTALGAIKITKHGWTAYGEPEGLGAAVTWIFETPAGELFVGSSMWRVSRFDGEAFTTVRPGLPASVTDASWRDVNNVIQDHLGDWWIGTRSGLYRFGKIRRLEDLARSHPAAVYTAQTGLANDDVTRVFEDSRGDVWIASWIPARDVLVRWERATGRFHHYSDAEGLKPFTSVVAFAEDGAGNVWVGFREGGLARYRGGRFSMVERDDGVPIGSINGLYRDGSGRIWAAGTRGPLHRVDHPDAERPRAIGYTRADGLGSDFANAVTGDSAGRIYVGTNRGIDRLDPATGRIKHYSTAEGLTGGEFKAAVLDRTGALWFCTTTGLLRLVPETDQSVQPTPVLIGALRVAGIARPLSALGESNVANLRLKTDENNIQIDFFGIGFRTGEALRYRYKLEGAAADWSPASPQRTVNYASLAPGSYRFLVTAIGTDGTESPSPATVAFQILPPIWRRWWFLALASVIVASAVAALASYRYRRARALRESENRFRTLAETASDAIITIDEHSRIVLVNQAAEKIFGYTREELIGADLTSLMPESLRDRHHAGFTRYMQSGRRNMAWDAIELPGLHKGGHEVPLEISFGEFTRNGRRFFTGIARDITERKRSEQALRRSREERLGELERVRKRIATDLHDDIGSSLTRISLLGEIVRQRIGNADKTLLEPLSSIATQSRELVDSMSDIVWAINPTKDHLSDLSQRMRRFASDVLTARQIDFRFKTPDREHDISMGANIRRELFLLFKEAVNNLVRHSGCTEADLEFGAEPDCLVLVVSDNGRGFDASQSGDGHGLQSMRERTQGLGGHFEIVSHPGRGTLLTFRIPFVEHGSSASLHEYAVTKRHGRG
jgi:PAS domain S-box-containing protein